MSGGDAADWDARLVSEDVRIAFNVLRSTFGPWRDRLIASAALVLLAVGLRSWSGARDPEVLVWVTLAGAAVSGIAAALAIYRRLRFHAADGVLAALALRSRPILRYALTWHAVVGAGVLLVTLIARGPLSLAAIAYFAGAIVAHGTCALPPLRGRPAWLVRLRFASPWSSGAIGAVLVAGGLLCLSRAASLVDVRIAGGIGAAAAMLALTHVDAKRVCFMAVAGLGAGRSILTIGRSGYGFTLLAAPLCVMLDRAAGAIVGLICIVGLVLMTLRVLVYRLHAKPAADCIVAMLVGLCGLVVIAVPILAPIVMVASLWHFGQRARERTWLIA